MVNQRNALEGKFTRYIPVPGGPRGGKEDWRRVQSRLNKWRYLFYKVENEVSTVKLCMPEKEYKSLNKRFLDLQDHEGKIIHNDESLVVMDTIVVINRNN